MIAVEPLWKSEHVTPEQDLAIAVIEQAKYDMLHYPNMRDECYAFLTGQTEVARLWWGSFNLSPFTGSAEEVFLKVIEAERLRKLSSRGAKKDDEGEV
jgi:hypothetical protein